MLNVARVVAPVTKDGGLKVQVMNCGESVVKLRQPKLSLGYAEPLTEFETKDFEVPDSCALNMIDAELLKESRETPTYEGHFLEEPDLVAPPLEKIVEDVKLSDANITEEQKNLVVNLLGRFRHLFALNDKAPKATPTFQFDIRLQPGARPTNLPPYRTTPEKREFISNMTKTWVEHGICRPSTSAWAHPVVAAKKRGAQRFRLCTDLRQTNLKTIPERFPMPKIDEVLDFLGGNALFTTCDMAQGYLQIPVAENTIEKLAFVTHEGLFEFVRMPFGATNAGQTYQRAMNTALAGLNWQICLPFVDT
jgi:hypothetical protein